jgi:hypothetical protein
MIVRLSQIDGKLPNLALMRIAAYHKDRGDEVVFRRNLEPDLLEPDYDRVYGSCIFKFSEKRLQRFLTAFPDAIVGGTGTNSVLQVEDVISDKEKYDYSMYPEYNASLGFTARGCRLKCKFCLTPGNLIITGDGLKKIEDVKIGDKVLTHTGKYSRVLKTMYRWYDGDVVTLKSGALSELFPTTVTDNHRIWTRHVSYYSGGQRLTLFNWIESGEIKAGYPQRARDQYAYPRVSVTEDFVQAPGASSWEQYDRGVGIRELNDILVDDNLMEVLGFYLAEGHLSHVGRPHLYTTVFSFGHTPTEIIYALRVSETLRRYGLDPTVEPVPTGTRVTAHSGRFARWLNSQFGSGSATKTVPLWVRLLPISQIKTLLQAWCEGDGWYHVKKGSRTWKITTVSPNLAVFCRELALKCGYSATINRHKPSNIIQGRLVSAKPSYTIIFHEPAGSKHSVVQDAAYVYSQAQQSEVSRYCGFVYNLEVEGDHSYCTPAFAISNCVVPDKEGKPKTVNTVYDIWRGGSYPKHLHLLDNDFFGQDREQWQARVDEIVKGGFKVSFNQGINTRLINEESAGALAQMPYYDDQFKVKRLYTAWDNQKDFKIFFRGIDMLEAAGVRPKDVLAYMLIGFAKDETMEDIQWRFDRMRERGIFAFPMVYDRSRPDLRAFARWAIRGLFHSCTFEEYRTTVRKRDPREGNLLDDDEVYPSHIASEAAAE